MDVWRPLELKDYTKEIQNVVRHVVGLSDEVFMPKAWTVNYFGSYSKKKVKLLCEMFGLKMADFDNVIEMDMERQRTYAQGLDKYLKEMEAKGQTVYEDEKDKDGNPVKMAVGPLI
jgi:NOL1/NOP2/fmu family ribosome biogenesis protein